MGIDPWKMTTLTYLCIWLVIYIKPSSENGPRSTKMSFCVPDLNAPDHIAWHRARIPAPKALIHMIGCANDP